MTPPFDLICRKIPPAHPLQPTASKLLAQLDLSARKHPATSRLFNLLCAHLLQTAGRRNMEGIMRAMVFTCWVSSVLAAHDGTAGSSYGNSYMYTSECDGTGTATSEPTRPTVGRSCKTMNNPTNDTPTDVQLRTTDIAVTIRQGEDGQPDQYRWATIPRNFDSTT